MNVIPNFETNENASLDEALLREFYNDSLVIQEFQDFANLIQSDEGGLLQELLSEIPTNKQFVEDLHASTSNYAIEEIPYKSIEIVIGGNNDIDNQQPSTSSSLVSSHPESLQDAKIYARIRELREAGLWSSTRLPKCEDPPRRKTHWDYLLEEVQWIAKDFSHERKVKLRWAKQFAYNAKMTWRKHYGTSKEVKKHVDEEREAKRICGVIARMVRDFWTNVDKVVDFRANEIVESKKRRALDQHLDFLVGAATSILRDSPVIGSLHSERSLRLNDELSEYDGETDEEEEDDESTLDKEEKHLQQAHVELEVSELSKEANMELDEILTTLPAGYLKHMEQLGYKLPSGQQELDDEESMDDSVTMQSGELCSRLDEKPDLQNVDYSKLNSDKSEDRREQLDNIAEAALQFQPKGYTLETTEIKTEVPFLLEGTLREYQLVGLDWLVTLYEKNLNGILADEMGLGKTIQTIALLAHLACSRAIWGPHLIIVPTSVILNWEMELKKWCPSLKVLTYFGTAKERAEKRKGWSKSNAFHVCVTSYKLATQDARAFKKKAWQYVILDEAQNIKNFKSQRWQILLGLRSRRRLLLTGTPLQNNLMELWALLHFLMPHVFASHDDFKEWFHNPFSGMVEGTTEVDKAIVDRLHKVLRPFVLRRLKKDVEKQLPSKSEKVIPCSLSKRQRFLYNEFLSKRSTVENLKSGNMLSVLGIIIQLRKCCNHPNLFEPRPVVSPLVVQPTSSQFPSIVFPLRSELEFSTPNHLIEIPNAFSSYWTWDFSENMSKIDEQSATNVEERVPVIEKTVKFNRGEDGGHFFKVDEVICSDQNGESAYIDDSADIPHTEFLNNTRKRRIPSPNTESDDTAGINQRLTLLSVTKQGSESALFNAANLEIQGALRRRNEEYRRISLYLNDARRIMCLKEGPVLCEEVRTLASLTDPNQGSAMVKFFKNEKRRNNLDEILEAQLFDKVNELISQRLLEWLEISMSRFLLCVRKIFINELRTEPIVTAHDRYEYGLSQVRVLPLLRTKFKSPLTDKAMVYSELEFPELRLIEYDCGKLQVLARLLEQLYENKHRCLIFTQMSRMLDILQAFLSYHNYKYFRLDGATHISQRQAMMERFNADESVFCFILSTRSGGIGVNLTGADTVVFYDSDWNPTMDAQAQDRCHRIGQTRNVTIYRLISERTIEENILTKSMQKRRLGEMAIDEGEFTPDFFKSAGNLRELFSNEESVANLIMPCKDQVTSAKDVEKAMLCVEDKQDVVAAEMAEKETKAEAAEFDENMIQTTQNYDLRDIDSPSEQYMELISGLKPVERYAVNFLANEYRPVLDKEFEETEALLRAKQRELLEAHNGEEPMEITEDYAKSDDVGSIDITYDVNSLEEVSATPKRKSRRPQNKTIGQMETAPRYGTRGSTGHVKLKAGSVVESLENGSSDCSGSSKRRGARRVQC